MGGGSVFPPGRIRRAADLHTCSGAGEGILSQPRALCKVVDTGLRVEIKICPSIVVIAFPKGGNEIRPVSVLAAICLGENGQVSRLPCVAMNIKTRSSIDHKGRVLGVLGESGLTPTVRSGTAALPGGPFRVDSRG